jgi:hypothetical protein
MFTTSELLELKWVDVQKATDAGSQTPLHRRTEPASAVVTVRHATLSIFKGSISTSTTELLFGICG